MESGACGEQCMTATGLMIFAAAYFTAVASPGPGMAATVARALGHGMVGIPAWIAGFVLGDLIWFWVAAIGLAAIAQTYSGVLDGIRYAGAAYLLFIAWKLWTAPVVALDAAPSSDREPMWRTFLSSLALTLGNPKVIVFFMAILPTIVDLDQLTIASIATISLVIALVMITVLLSYSIAAARARNLLATPSALRAVNRVTGGVIAGAAIAVARS
jgi:threonine/homoserine/homoserine lactone efflux protein